MCFPTYHLAGPRPPSHPRKVFPCGTLACSPADVGPASEAVEIYTMSAADDTPTPSDDLIEEVLDYIIGDGDGGD